MTKGMDLWERCTIIIWAWRSEAQTWRNPQRSRGVGPGSYDRKDFQSTQMNHIFIMMLHGFCQTGGFSDPDHNQAVVGRQGQQGFLCWYKYTVLRKVTSSPTINMIIKFTFIVFSCHIEHLMRRSLCAVSECATVSCSQTELENWQCHG